MKHRIALLALAMLAWGGSALALPEAILGPGIDTGRTPYHQTGNVSLSADTLYTLTGLYYVESGASLTIPAGTVCKADTAATLIIKPGGQIFANGEQDAPIVFTSRKAPGQRARGDWGGVIILGNAPVNKVNPLIEGGIIEGTFGGANPLDNSGVFKYVRIEYCGYRFQLNNEINGLTLGGVGRGTELHHVQVSYSFDDSYECFGGTVDMHHIVAFGGTDDEFDSDFGWTGNVQFAFGIRDENMWDPTGESNGFESDNDGSSTSTDEPYTHPVYSNVTLIGPARSDAMVGNLPAGNKFQYSAVLRRSTRTSVFNSVIAGYPWGISLRDPFTIQWATNDILRWENVSVAAWQYPDAAAQAAGTIHDVTRWSGVKDWFNTTGNDNFGVDLRNPSAVGLGDCSDLNYPNPVPQTGSELIGTAAWGDSYLQDAFFTSVNYRGAFDPTLPMDQQWTAGWTNFNPQGWDQDTAAGDVASSFRLAGNFPNPFNPKTEIRFSLPETAAVTLTVFDLQGRQVRELGAGAQMTAGDHVLTWNGKSDAGEAVASGVYFYRLSAGDFSQTRKMTLLK
ncbi:MAG: T9SS type A sorting domain-containing protein [Candidatus Latescibacteria bacterium]|nr:T9SS type A sorting domain-containing protein [bacterium]MCB9514200.1 T9SS type A sorting domain-containing protein [Candidatus Latescibacterota bacterium]MCB9515861.1 T9SS type A sorting domain-containing protein [Candidatus Latescibacterota bacterium]